MSEYELLPFNSAVVFHHVVVGFIMQIVRSFRKVSAGESELSGDVKRRKDDDESAE